MHLALEKLLATAFPLNNPSNSVLPKIGMIRLYYTSQQKLVINY